MDPRLVAAKALVVKAKSEYLKLQKEVQKKCKHKEVAETPLRRLEYFDSLEPARICINCGYEEHAWHWPSHVIAHSSDTGGLERPKDLEQTKLNAEFIKVISDRDEFYKLRP